MSEDEDKAEGAGQDTPSSAYRSKCGPLGPEKFENDSPDITPQMLDKAYGEEGRKEQKDFLEEVRGIAKKAQGEKQDDADSKAIADAFDRAEAKHGTSSKRD